LKNRRGNKRVLKNSRGGKDVSSASSIYPSEHVDGAGIKKELSDRMSKALHRVAKRD